MMMTMGSFIERGKSECKKRSNDSKRCNSNNGNDNIKKCNSNNGNDTAFKHETGANLVSGRRL